MRMSKSDWECFHGLHNIVGLVLLCTQHSIMYSCVHSKYNSVCTISLRKSWILPILDMNSHEKAMNFYTLNIVATLSIPGVVLKLSQANRFVVHPYGLRPPWCWRKGFGTYCPYRQHQLDNIYITIRKRGRIEYFYNPSTLSKKFELSFLTVNNFWSKPAIKNLSVQNCSLGMKTSQSKFQFSAP